MKPLIRWVLTATCLAALSLVTACGDLPEPFIGNPGANGRLLAQPPAPRLAVPAPSDMLLTDEASHNFAGSLARALQQNEVPAVAQASQRTDWTLVGKASEQGGSVTPVFTVQDPSGKDRGNIEGAPIPAAAWAAATPVTLQQAASEAAPKIATALTNIQTAIVRADPNSLYNRAPKVVVPEVTGAPGDGNAALTREMRKRLATLGPIIQTSTDGADFVVQGQVKVVPVANHQQRVEIQWIVTVPPSDERGRVVQLNEIPAGTLDHYWGDVAVVVATEASQGVENVLQRQTGHAPDAAAGPAAGAPQSQPAGSPAAPADAPPAVAPPNGAGTPRSRAPSIGTSHPKSAGSSGAGTVRGQQQGALLEPQVTSADPLVGCTSMAPDQHEDCRLQQQSPIGRGSRG
jgi:hypothetical protein